MDGTSGLSRVSDPHDETRALFDIFDALGGLECLKVIVVWLSKKRVFFQS